MIQHKTVSLADQVFDHIETDILSGKYQKGELLTETKLSAELGVSRTPIREALRRLEQEHLIEETGKGVIVVGIDENDVEDIFQLRFRIEPLAAQRAAERHNEYQLSKLREAVEFQEFYLGKRDADRIKLMDNQFHETIYKMSGSIVLYDVLLPLHRKLQKYRRVSVSTSSRAEASVKEHRAILDAITSGDGEKSCELVKQHLENAYHHIVKKG